MKRYLRKNFDFRELVNICHISSPVQHYLNCSSDKDFKCVSTNFLRRSLFRVRFKIFLPDHPEPQ